MQYAEFMDREKALAIIGHQPTGALRAFEKHYSHGTEDLNLTRTRMNELDPDEITPQMKVGTPDYVGSIATNLYLDRPSY